MQIRVTRLLGKEKGAGVVAVSATAGLGEMVFLLFFDFRLTQIRNTNLQSCELHPPSTIINLEFKERRFEIDHFVNGAFKPPHFIPMCASVVPKGTLHSDCNRNPSVKTLGYFQKIGDELRLMAPPPLHYLTFAITAAGFARPERATGRQRHEPDQASASSNCIRTLDLAGPALEGPESCASQSAWLGPEVVHPGVGANRQTQRQ